MPLVDPVAGQRRHLIITVHGIRTFGLWQTKLEALVTARAPHVDVRTIAYGYFSALAFVFPPVRWLETLRIRRILRRLCREQPWDRIDVVAHSFGTHLTAYALRGIDKAERRSYRIHTILLAGSVLRPWFPWHELLDRTTGCVERVVNDCGTRDSILLLSQMIPLTGMAGRVGFRGALSPRLRNRFFPFGHGGYFTRPGFMEEWWVPLLTTEDEARAHDERSGSAWAAPKEWVLSYFEPIKLVAYTAVFALLLNAGYQTWREAQTARQAALVDRALSRVELTMGARDHAQSALVALTAYDMAHRNRLRSVGDIEERLRQVLGEPAFSHVLIAGNGPAATAVAASDDENLLVAGWEDGTLTCWTLGGASEPRTVALGDSRLNALKFRAASYELVAGAENGAVWIAQVSADCSLSTRRLKPCIGAVLSLAFASESSVVAGSEAQVCYWPDAAAEPRIIRRGEGVLIAASTPGGQALALSTGDRLEIWSRPDANFGSPREVTIPGDESITATAFSATGDLLAIASFTSEITPDLSSLARRGRVHVMAPGLVTRAPVLLAHECRSEIMALAFSGEQAIVGACADGSIRLWHLDRAYSESFEAHSYGAVAIAPSRQSRRFFSAGGRDKTVRSWHPNEELAPLSLRTERVPLAVAFHGRGQTVLAAVQSQPALTVWDLTKRQDPPRFFPSAVDLADPSAGEIRSVATRPPHNEIFVTGNGTFGLSSATEVRLWTNLKTEPAGRVLGRHDGSVIRVAFDATGRWLASIGEEDRTVRVWDLGSDKSFVVTAQSLGGAPLAIAFDVRVERHGLAVGLENGVVQFVSLTSDRPSLGRRLAADASRPSSPVHDLAVSSQGWVAAGMGDGVINLWDLERGERPHLLDAVLRLGGAPPVLAVEFSPDGHILAAGSFDGRVWVWNVATLDEAPAVLRGAQNGVYSLAFDHDGARLAAGVADDDGGIVRIWPTFLHLREHACTAMILRNLSCGEWTEAFGSDEPYSAACPERPQPACAAPSSTFPLGAWLPHF